MTKTLANALFRYFQTLYSINQNLIQCCGMDLINNQDEFERLLQEIIMDIPRLIPYAAPKKGDYTISTKDGLMPFSDELPYLKEGLEIILQENYAFLKDLKTIRNKLEHEMHAVEILEQDCGSLVLFAIKCRVPKKEKEIEIYAVDFLKVVKMLNSLYAQIQEDVRAYAWEEQKEKYAYYERLTKFDFKDFNQIYDSSILRIVGKSLFVF